MSKVLDKLMDIPLKQKLRQGYYRSGLYRRLMARGIPKTLHNLPLDPLAGDSECAEAIRGGAFPLGQVLVEAGQDPWLASMRGRALDSLQGFAWLRDLRADPSDESAERARELTALWLARFSNWDEIAWRPDILGKRILHWLYSRDFLLDGADAQFEHDYFEMLSVQVRHLAGLPAPAATDWGAFPIAGGRIAAGMALPNRRDNYAAGLKILLEAIANQILTDGGHVSRNPSTHFQVLGSLIEIAGLLNEDRPKELTEVLGTVERMATFLRSVRLGDGSLARFNGGREEMPTDIDQLLGVAGQRGKALLNMPQSGFERLQAGRTAVVADVGLCDPALWENAHAGLFSFEMTVGRQRLVVNCGGCSDPFNRWHDALRLTPAHSTLAVNGVDSTPVRQARREGEKLPEINSRRRDSDGNNLVEMIHGGYLPTLGLTHRRVLFLSADGTDFRGQDVLDGKGGREFTIRFHIHPDVAVRPVGDGKTIQLGLAGGQTWRFLSTGGNLDVEESVYFEDGMPPRRTKQIVIAGPLRGRGTQVNWAFRIDHGRPTPPPEAEYEQQA